MSAWRGLRPALEAGAAEGSRATPIESASEEPTKVNLKTRSPRAPLEEPSTDGDAKRLAAFESSDSLSERSQALARAARRAAAAPNDGGGDDDDVERGESLESSRDDDAVEAESAVVEDAPSEDDVEDDEVDALASDETRESSKALVVDERDEEARALRGEGQKLALDRQASLRGSS